MSLKGSGSELFVGKKQSSIINLIGNKKTIPYGDLSHIDYMYSARHEPGYLDFVYGDNHRVRFEFGKKVNEKVSRTVALIRENNPEIPINEYYAKDLKFYERWWFIILTMFWCCAPIGIFLMWYKKKSTLSFRIIVTFMLVLAWGSITHMQFSHSVGKVESYATLADSGFSDNEIETEEPEIEYAKYSVGDMMADLDSNALNASEKYKDQYVEITGKLSNIDSDGKYISLDPDDDGFYLTGVQCYIKDDDQKSKVANMKIDQIITLKGKVTRVGEVLGYSLDIDGIE